MVKPKTQTQTLAEKTRASDLTVFDPFGSHYLGCHRCHGKGVVPVTSPVHRGGGNVPFEVVDHLPCPDTWHVVNAVKP